MTTDLDTSDPNSKWEKIEDSDIVDLFNLAEEIQKNRDFYNDKLDKLYLSRDIVLIISLFMWGLWLLPTVISNNFLGNLPENLSRMAIGFMFFYIFWMLLGVSFNSHIRKIKRKLRSEQYTMEETVDLLREIEPMLHYRHSNHGLKKIEFKLRLSRFNIGQKYEEPTSILNEILNLNKDKE